jgi:hypothetical protein
MWTAQQRGFREGYARFGVPGRYGRHNLKFGADAIFSSVHEALEYNITDPAQFDPDIQSQFQFARKARDREQAAYAQDSFSLGNWNVSAGVRYDRYRFLTAASAWSPRLGVSRYLPSLGLLVHASYDRIFQTPAIENLLLASSPAVDLLAGEVLRLPVAPGRANFYEIGLARAFSGKLRVEASVFRRNFRNYPDDDPLLNTGVSFPISFSSARIRGEEIKIELPRWGWFSGYAAYANQLGIAQGPVTGGLFLGEDTGSLLQDRTRFFVTQDQRNTARARIRVQPARRTWAALGTSYGSGLPAELDGGDDGVLLAHYGAQVLSRVNFERQRLRPSFSLDLAGGVSLMRKDRNSVALEAQVANLTNRLNVLNFASLFSGTAIALPRSVDVQLSYRF